MSSLNKDILNPGLRLLEILKILKADPPRKLSWVGTDCRDQSLVALFLLLGLELHYPLLSKDQSHGGWILSTHPHSLPRALTKTAV